MLSANDSMALGVLEALKEANRSSIVIGINGILPAVKQIEAGAILATVDFNMFKIGCTATRAAVRHLKKEPLPEKSCCRPRSSTRPITRHGRCRWISARPEWSEVVR